MSFEIKNLEPREVISNFEKLAKIPHGSGNEEEISLFLVKFAEELGLWAYRDKAKNVYIKMDATAGMENKPTVLLQGHMDMVCEKESSSSHDFEKDGLKLLTDGEFIFADKTTLGADDCIAVAIMMALMENKEIPHPPLEFLITTGEEVGLTGAFAYEGDKLDADMMINIDTEEEGVLLTSCAGGENLVVTKELSQAEAKGEGSYLSLKVDGLMGGHSGIDIDKERANASKLLSRLMLRGFEESSFELCSFEGGTKDNAITRDARAVIFVKKENEAKLREALADEAKIIKNELNESDPNFVFEVAEEEGKWLVSSEKTTLEAISLIYSVPNGVIKKSTVIDGFVVSSLNMGIVRKSEDKLELIFMVRSSIETQKAEIGRRVRLIANAFGAEYKSLGGYPGWQFAPESRLRDIASKVYKESFGEELRIEAIHAGLECGIIKSKKPNLDIIAIGPNVFDCHTPREKLEIKSLERVWLFVKNILAEICR